MPPRKNPTNTTQTPNATANAAAAQIKTRAKKPVKRNDITSGVEDEIRMRMAESQLEDQRFQIRAFVSTWEENHKKERELKGKVAMWIFLGLGAEILFGNVAFYQYGVGNMHFPEWVAQTFFVGMYTQIIGIVTIVVRSLFPSKSKSASVTEMQSEYNKFKVH